MTAGASGPTTRPGPLGGRPLLAPVAVALGAVATCAVVLVADPTTPGGLVPECPTRALLGVTCPGCGSARMVWALLHGDVPGALRWNAFGVAALVLLVWTYAVWVLARVPARRLPRWQDWRWAPLVTLAVVVGWFVVRLLPMEPFGSLRV